MNNSYLGLIVLGIALFIIGLSVNMAFIGAGAVFLLAGLSIQFKEKRWRGIILIEGEIDK